MEIGFMLEESMPGHEESSTELLDSVREGEDQSETGGRQLCSRCHGMPSAGGRVENGIIREGDRTVHEGIS
jgi:hypothetical protein